MRRQLILLSASLIWAGIATAKSSVVPKIPKKLNSKSKKKVRALASEPVVQVFSEKTNFEAMVRKADELARRPAGFVANARVIAIRRELGLTRSEADAAPQDVILNAGFKEGISEGMVLNVARKVPILDPYKDNQQSEISVQFASIRVLHVEEDVAVARIEKMDPIRSGVGIGVRGILVGDYVGSNK